MDNGLYEVILDKYCPDNFYLDKFCIETPVGLVKKSKRDFDFIAFSDKKIIFFIPLPEDVPESAIVSLFRASLNCLVNRLAVSVNCFVPCGVSREGYYFFNRFNDRVFCFPKANEEGQAHFLELVENEMAFGSVLFSYDMMRDFLDKLSLSSGFKTGTGNGAGMKITADGSAYVYKHGAWREASEINTETFYLLTVFTGAFGGHLFYQRKFLKAAFYLFTFGMCGIGWLFDSLEILLGIYRDAEGRYLLPLQNKASGFLLLLAGAVVSCVLGLVLFFVFRFLFGSISNVFAGLF